MMECWGIAKYASLYESWLASLGLLVVAMDAIGSAKSGTSDCYRIREDDVRYYCMALVRHDTGGCYQIKDGDRRNLCLAQVKGHHSYCCAIREHDARRLCMAEATP